MMLFTILTLYIAICNAQNHIIGKPEKVDLTLDVKVEIENVGNFTFKPLEKSTLQPDVFADGHFSILDCLLYLKQQGKIEFEYTFNETCQCYVWSMNSFDYWWYHVAYDDGHGNHNYIEDSQLRPSLYLVKDKQWIHFYKSDEPTIAHKRSLMAVEVSRRKTLKDPLVLPEVHFEWDRFPPTEGSPNDKKKTFNDVKVKPFNIRPKVFKEGVTTAADVYLSMGEQLLIETELLWYDSLWNDTHHSDNPWIRAYRLEAATIDGTKVYHSGACGWVYEMGEIGHDRNLVHVQPDERVVWSPEYLRTWYIKLGPC